MRQLEFQFEEPTNLPPSTVRQEVHELLENPDLYVSKKRVSVVHEGSIQFRPKMTGTDSAKALFFQYWKQYPGNDQERVVVACLDTKHKIQSIVEVTVGTLDASLIHARETFKPAIIEGSSSIILSHNHPSGDPTPSKEDRAVTDRLTKIGELLGIEVLDHIIYGDGTGEVVSIREV